MAQELGQKFFNDKLLALCMTWLADSVYAIRDAAVNNLKKLTQVFGVAWSSQHVLPKVIALFSHPNYMYRMTTLMAVGAMTEVLGPDITATSLLPLVRLAVCLFERTFSCPASCTKVLRMSNDPVPNIRFNVAKTLQAMSAVLSNTVVQAQVKPVMAHLAREDADADVKYYASVTLAFIEKKGKN